MRAILIDEKRLDEMVEAMLTEMELKSQKDSLSFREVNYKIRELIDRVKGEK